ncbi:hypothetical protein D0869_14599 [Hortaea werneckii]|uniref:Fork-head domain-containing protein n=1 Tax=Hortaea werneckii TaxID=91943 RepID=A0A3M6YNS5_HORWE|nr:hypothetical protein KC324_g9593 [Hortaea werneckii]RMX72452.1 hypothetical protein D0869_14599 [Hortaea werneckii]RMY04663.1 hypothetical protein D0868_06834 [Hortaea werneckii]RMY37948.1 hypothetical protein D0866_02935 [Hortaea werneckii]
MPPSGRKGKTRARRPQPAEPPHEPSDAETPEAIATPSRSSTRKRARGSEAQATASRNTRRKIKDNWTADREDTEGTEAQEPSDAETEPATPGEQEIIQSLKVADRHVNATEDFANDLLEGQEHVPGYGKIAGRDWAFIIRKVEVNIGRPEAQEKLMQMEENGHPPSASSKTVVDIDLGPDRQVSRSHAIIAYDPEAMQWYIVVNGRNGLRVDNNLLKRGMKSYLRNGSVIEIANTQMAFITTAQGEGEGPIWDASIIKQAQKSSEDDDEGEDDTRPGGNRLPGPPSSRTNVPEPTAYSGDFGGSQPQNRTHPHSQRAIQATPGTPLRPQQSFMKSSPAANYARGVMMESTETIDYSADNAKDLKPPHSYAQLIGMAILSTQEQQMTLNNIYKWIMANYAFYRFNTGGWQNSIRHNLSLNKAFTKIARRTDEPGKGMKWMIEPTEFDNFVQQGMKGCRRPQPLPPATQSTLGSPTSPMHAMRPGTATNGQTKQDGEDSTPPMHSFQPLFPSATEAYTPDRGPRRQGENRASAGNNGDGPEYDFLTRSTPRNGMNAIANAAGSPPALYVNDEGRVGPLDTPFPLRPSQRFAPPSTLKRPSDFIQFSSPAPFWKMEGLVGSTPFKPYDLSPLKTPFSSIKKQDPETKKEEPESDDKKAVGEPSSEANGRQSPVIHSSSPPRMDGEGRGDILASPTMSRPATAVAKTLTQLASSAPSSAKEQAPHHLSQELPQPPSGRAGTEEREQTRTPSVPPPHALPAPPKQALTYTRPPSAQPSMGPANGMHSAAPPSHPPQQGPPSGYHHQPLQAQPMQNSSFTSSAGPVSGFPMDDGDDEGIDLAKGFQPIGAFHQRNHLTMGMGMAAPAFGR